MTDASAQHPVRVEDAWIPLSDGSRLYARVWRPADASVPVPALLEYLPYRAGDWTAARDAARHPYYASHGYASVRVDIRGSGNSGGVLRDEYLPGEQADAVEVIRWLAAQPWCDGAVGMFGISWGGFNSLQVAALSPPELKAIITVCSTDDRFGTDVHYLGGCVLGIDMAAWAATMFAWNARPPDPAVVGDGWRELWLSRLEGSRPFIETWLEHQHRDEYWRQGSVCEDYSAIEVPVYAVGGWADPYRSTVLRLLAGLSAPCKGLIGPWPHRYPEQDSAPGPMIGFLQDSLRWWDHWLKGEETGIMDEPQLRVWMQDSVAPRPYHRERPGRWVAEEAWPSTRVDDRALWLSADGLADTPGESSLHSIVGLQTTGVDAGRYFPIGNRSDLPPDQRGEDGRSLVFDAPVLDEAVEILGVPEVELRVRCDRRDALVAARLCDVAPDGASTLVSRGLLNLSHRDGHAEPEPLEPGVWYRIRIPLLAIAHGFAAGHRIRLALSPTYWPWAWPSAEAATVTLDTAWSRLVLPVRPPAEADARLAPFQPPESAPPLFPATDTTPELDGTGERTVTRDIATGRVVLTVDPNYAGGRRTYPNGLEYEERATETYTIVEGDPLSASARSSWQVEIGRGAWQTRIETTSELRADADSFLTDNRLCAYESETLVFEHTWTARIPRRLV